MNKGKDADALRRHVRCYTVVFPRGSVFSLETDSTYFWDCQREDTSIEIRKNKREEQLQKRRGNIGNFVPEAPTTQVAVR